MIRADWPMEVKMSRKYSWLALAALLAVFGVLALGDSPLNHRVMLGTLYTAGEMELHPGEYVIAIHSHGPTVQITELSTGESQFVLAVVERSLQTFERTEVVSRREGEVNRIMEIRLGGTTSRILFE
jgi:hypothetical protein